MKSVSLRGATLWFGALGISGCTALLGDFQTGPESSDAGSIVTMDATDMVDSAVDQGLGNDQSNGDDATLDGRNEGESPDVATQDVGSADASVDSESGAAEAGCAFDQLLCGGSCVPNDVKNCGVCGNDCNSLPHVSGATACASGNCTFAGSACAFGFADCDGKRDNGCEADLSQASHCGACGATCSGGTPRCTPQGGTFACASGCPASMPTLCGASCVDTTADPSNCGTCGHVCPAVTFGNATCANSACDFACNGGFHKCGAVCADNTSANSCGTMSCTPCPAAPSNGVATCNGTTCDFSCNSGFHRCGALCADNSSVNSCGASCNACIPPANGSATCNGVSCVNSCLPGYSPCSGACVNEQNDNANCGSCAKQCTGVNCASGFCVVRDGQTQPIAGSSSCSANYMFGITVSVPNAITVTALGSIIKTVAAGNTFVMGLYTDTGTQPGSLIVQTPQAVMSPAGNQEVPVTSTFVNPGTYWLVVNTGPATTTSWAWGYSGTYFYLPYTYTGTMPSAMPAGNGTGTGFNFYLVGYQ